MHKMASDASVFEIWPDKVSTPQAIGQLLETTRNAL